MTTPEAYSDSLATCEALARRLPEPQDLFTGVDGRLSKLPTNVLQFLRRGDRDLLHGAPFLHHRFVLVTCLRESGCIVVDGTIFHMQPGQGFLIFPYQNHYYARLKHADRIRWLFTTFEYSDPAALDSMRNTVVTFNAVDLGRLHDITLAYLETRHITKGTAHDMPLALASLLAGLLNRQQMKTQLRGTRLPEGPHTAFLRPLFLYIEHNLEGRIPVEALARTVHLSSSRLRARFKHLLGIGIGEFVRNTRIHRACSLLNSTDLNISQVAEKCGFNSVYAFSRTFRHVVGKPPTVFRASLHP